MSEGDTQANLPHYKILPLVQPNPDGKPIDKEAICEMCSVGLSECPPEDRCLAWLVMFGVYPSDASEWPSKLKQTVESYTTFVDEFQMTNWHTRTFAPNIQKEEYKLPNNSLMHTIHGDIVRTGRHIFFLPAEEPPDGDHESEILAPFIYHMRRLERILYVFASVNRSSAYMQGFNELLPPLYFVLCSAKELFQGDMMAVEALAFACFHELFTTTSLNEFYITQDNSSIIMHKLKTFQQILHDHLPQAEKIINKFDIHPLHYCYKWYNLLFAQELELPNLLILWDSLFAHIRDLMNFAYYIGIAILKTNAHKLKADDFAATMDALQNLKITNVYPILKDANIMYYDDQEPNTITKRMKRLLSNITVH